jgi:MFS family permease
VKGGLGDLSARGRWILLGCLVCQMGLGCGYVFGAMLKHVVADFEWSRRAFSIGSAPLLVSFALAAPLAGRLTERLGARRVLTAACLLLAAALGLMSRVDSLAGFVLATTLLGVALAGLGDVPVGAVAARWTAQGRGLALGIVYVGSNVGGALVPILAERVAAWGSWRASFLAVAGAALGLILPFAAFVVREPRPGELPRSDPPAAPVSAGAAPAARDLTLAQALRTRSFWILAGVLVVFYFYYLAVTQHLIAYLSDLGFSDARAAASFGGSLAVGIVAKLGVGAVADRAPRKAALLANFALVALASCLLLLVREPAWLTAFLVVHGFATAAENVVFPLVIAECFGVAHLASIYGALMLSMLLGGVLGPIFAGSVFDAAGEYGPAFRAFAGLNLLALLALAAVRRETS